MIKINATQEALDCHKKYVSKVFDKIIKDKFIKRGTPRSEKYLPNSFLIFLRNNFDELISAGPIRLLEIHYEFAKLSFSEIEVKVIDDFIINTGYKKFPNKEFLNHLNIDTCVYCNRNYTLDLRNLNNARAQLDHWFPKANFPILTLSFYNLIPSCHSCNHIKGMSKKYDWSKALENMNHPYFDKNIFSFSFNYVDLNNFNVKIKVKNDSKTEKTLTFNKTKEIYNSHSNKELKDLLDLRLKYSENYINTLINKTFKGIISKEEIYRMIFGIEINREKYHERPFSKFKHDIIEELKNIK